mmetsp:Transcript_32815/g.91346  ORF Transcript_32815/g.91346 Transcript_32815/m.91346 type:complete len:322 (-) Transcript_32815:107-1072(-)
MPRLGPRRLRLVRGRGPHALGLGGPAEEKDRQRVPADDDVLGRGDSLVRRLGGVRRRLGRRRRRGRRGAGLQGDGLDGPRREGGPHLAESLGRRLPRGVPARGLCGLRDERRSPRLGPAAVARSRRGCPRTLRRARGGLAGAAGARQALARAAAGLGAGGARGPRVSGRLRRLQRPRLQGRDVGAVQAGVPGGGLRGLRGLRRHRLLPQRHGRGLAPAPRALPRQHAFPPLLRGASEPERRAAGGLPCCLAAALARDASAEALSGGRVSGAACAKPGSVMSKRHTAHLGDLGRVSASTSRGGSTHFRPALGLPERGRALAP